MENSLTTAYEFSIVGDMDELIDVKAIRVAKGMTQAQLGEEVGVDQSTVSNWEKGVTAPRGPARKLLAALSDARAAREVAE
jgi:DNA-binding transcriptional regulator YiaG